MKNIILVAFSILCLAGCSNNIDLTIEQGEYQSIKIGDTKDNVFMNLGSSLRDDAGLNGYYWVEMDDLFEECTLPVCRKKLLIQTRFDPELYPAYSKMERWRVYFKGSRSDFVEYKFCNELLCRIKRYRNLNEMP